MTPFERNEMFRFGKQTAVLTYDEAGMVTSLRIDGEDFGVAWIEQLARLIAERRYANHDYRQLCMEHGYYAGGTCARCQPAVDEPTPIAIVSDR